MYRKVDLVHPLLYDGAVSCLVPLDENELMTTQIS